MGNVYASQKPEPALMPVGPPLPPLQPSLIKPGVENEDTKLENPGTLEELHRRCKEIFPAAFEGARVVVNKGLSNHFQISHSLHLTSTPASGYRFGATYVGSQQCSPSEAYPVLLGDIDPSGSLNANMILQPLNNIRAKVQTQSNNGKFQVAQFSLDHKGVTSSTAVMCINPNILNGNGVYVGHYLQSVTKELVLGAELVCQQMPLQQGGLSALASVAARYSGKDFSASGTVGLAGVHLCYYQRASEQLQFGLELETSMRNMESTATLGYQVDIPQGDFVFKGSVDSNYTISGLLEKRMNPLPFSIAIGAMLNHKKNDFKLGIGIMIG